MIENKYCWLVVIGVIGGFGSGKIMVSNVIYN